MSKPKKAADLSKVKRSPMFDRNAKGLAYYDWFYFLPMTTVANGDGTYTHTYKKGVK